MARYREFPRPFHNGLRAAAIQMVDEIRNGLSFPGMNLEESMTVSQTQL